MSILEWIAHAKREFWNAGESRSLRSTLCETLDDLTRPTQLEIVENEWLLNYRDRKLGRNCYCCLDSQLAKGAEGRGALSEIKRVVNIPGCNNNLVRNVRKEFSPRGETFTHFPPSHSMYYSMENRGRISSRRPPLFANDWRRTFVKWQLWKWWRIITYKCVHWYWTDEYW